MEGYNLRPLKRSRNFYCAGRNIVGPLQLMFWRDLIFGWLDVVALVKLRRTCKAFYRFVDLQKEIKARQRLLWRGFDFNKKLPQGHLYKRLSIYASQYAMSVKLHRLIKNGRYYHKYFNNFYYINSLQLLQAVFYIVDKRFKHEDIQMRKYECTLHGLYYTKMTSKDAARNTIKLYIFGRRVQLKIGNITPRKLKRCKYCAACQKLSKVKK